MAALSLAGDLSPVKRSCLRCGFIREQVRILVGRPRYEPMNSNATDPMSALYQRLRKVGLKKKFVLQTILPEWWEDDVARTPAGYAQGLMILSRYAGLDISTLRDDSSELVFRGHGTCKFKKAARTQISELELTQAMAARAAHLAHAAAKKALLSPLRSASEIRQEVLASGAPWVNLQSLIDYCWKQGIPVLHVSRFPNGSKKADGIAAMVQGRPVIVLCRKEDCAAKQLFILAHEIGHIALDHVADDSVLIDEEMGKNERDNEERDADEFALQLLGGNPVASSIQCDGRLKSSELATKAEAIGHSLQVDPGHIVLKYAHHMTAHSSRGIFRNRIWASANGCLNSLCANPSALTLIRRRMEDGLDWSSLPEDSREFLRRVSGIEPAM